MLFVQLRTAPEETLGGVRLLYSRKLKKFNYILQLKNATFYPLKETGPFTEQTASSTTIHLIGRAV